MRDAVLLGALNVLLDEVQVSSSLWAVAPRQVSVALTNTCDLACPFCYAPKGPAVLDIELVAIWLAELDANGCWSRVKPRRGTRRRSAQRELLAKMREPDDQA